MQGPRAPWWVFGVAACVFGFLLLNLYAELFGPGAIGADLRYHDGMAVVVSVVPGFPAARAGLGPGDVIVTAAGQPVRTLFHWRAVLENAEVVRPLLLDIERGGIANGRLARTPPELARVDRGQLGDVRHQADGAARHVLARAAHRHPPAARPGGARRRDVPRRRWRSPTSCR